MIGELAEGILGGALRFIGRIFLELIVEVMIRGAGYLICRLFSKRVDSDSVFVLVVGILIWLVLMAGGYVLYGYLAEQLAKDACLDRGGAFDYVNKVCSL